MQQYQQRITFSLLVNFPGIASFLEILQSKIVSFPTFSVVSTVKFFNVVKYKISLNYFTSAFLKRNSSLGYKAYAATSTRAKEDFQ